MYKHRSNKYYRMLVPLQNLNPPTDESSLDLKDDTVFQLKFFVFSLSILI